MRCMKCLKEKKPEQMADVGEAVLCSNCAGQGPLLEKAIDPYMKNGYVLYKGRTGWLAIKPGGKIFKCRSRQAAELAAAIN